MWDSWFAQRLTDIEEKQKQFLERGASDPTIAHELLIAMTPLNAIICSVGLLVHLPFVLTFPWHIHFIGIGLGLMLFFYCAADAKGSYRRIRASFRWPVWRRLLVFSALTSLIGGLMLLGWSQSGATGVLTVTWSGFLTCWVQSVTMLIWLRVRPLDTGDWG